MTDMSIGAGKPAIMRQIAEGETGCVGAWRGYYLQQSSSRGNLHRATARSAAWMQKPAQTSTLYVGMQIRNWTTISDPGSKKPGENGKSTTR